MKIRIYSTNCFGKIDCAYEEKLKKYNLVFENGCNYIEVNTLQDIINIAKETDDIIIAINENKNNEPEIEIYDDYRE